MAKSEGACMKVWNFQKDGQHNIHLPVAVSLYNLYSNLTLKQKGHE